MQGGMVIQSVRHLATQYIRKALLPGDVAVDATMGNGHDTVMLAQCVGKNGHVFALDIQEQALVATQARLREAACIDWVSLFHTGHENLRQVIDQPVQAIMFNLGWLPGGDKKLTTRVPSTLLAVEGALEMLAPGGIITICIYPGHAEGQAERSALTRKMGDLPGESYGVLHHHFLNYPNNPPELLLIQKHKNL